MRAFLRFITSGVLPVSRNKMGNPTNGLDRLPRLVRFLEKYQCHTAQRFAMVCVREGLRRGVCSPLCAFVTGATVGDDVTVTAALGADPQTWGASSAAESKALVMSAFKVNPFGDEAKASLEEGDEDAHVLDPSSMPFIAWSQTPPEYLWALSRAWKKARGPDGKGEGDLLWYFEELLRAAKGEWGGVGWGGGMFVAVEGGERVMELTLTLTQKHPFWHLRRARVRVSTRSPPSSG